MTAEGALGRLAAEMERDGERPPKSPGNRSANRRRTRQTGAERSRALEAQAQLLAQLVADAERIAHRFGLRYASIEAERPSVTRRYGVCFQDGRIRIRLRHVSTGRPLKYSSLVNTLCHELAHLRHFNHGPRFKAFYLRILEWARSEAIYRPGHEADAAIAPLPVVPAARVPANAIARPGSRPAAARSAGSGPPPVQLSLFG